MNPQYLPPQQFGGPPQGFTSRVSPNATPQSFQNVPLGPPKPGQLPPQGDHLPPLSGAPNSMGQPPSSQPGQFSLSSVSGQMSRPQIPSNQLPPSAANDTNNPFGLPPTKNDNMPSSNLQNGPPQFQNGQMPGALPPNQPNRPPSNFAPPQPSQSQFGPPSISNQNMPLKPPSTQSNNLGQSLLPSGTPSQFNQPPLPGGPPSQMGQVSGPPSQMGQGSGPPSQLGQPHLSSGPPSQLGQMGGPPSHMGQAPMPGGPPSQMGPTSLPSGPGQPPLSQQLGQPGGPPAHLGHPPIPGGPIPSHLGQPASQPGPFGPMGQQNGPPNQFGTAPNMPNQFNNQMGPPKPGQFPQQSRSGQPPLLGQPHLPGQQNIPGQGPFSNVSGPYPPSGQGAQMPPLPGQPQYGTNQITNQLHTMNLSGPKPAYPGGPMRPMNGEGGPHMPPPLGQSGYVNGQQGRGPPGPGYPPMPGQGPLMPGQGPLMPGQGPPMPGQGPPMPGQGPPMPGQGPPMPGQGPPMPGQGPQMPGQGPQMPGQGQYPGPGGGYPQGNYQQPQQKQQRLDPDHMPSPIQVIQDDQLNRSGIFVTNQKGLVPPLVTTNFVVQDQGNCSPRFIRSTMYNVPITQDILKQTAVPFSLVISPMARQVEQEYPPPIVNFGELGPVRCIRCKAYMCPFMQFVDSGRRFQCLFCMATTDVPTEYFQHLDQTGLRMDRYERPELILGTYEFVATSDYCRNNVLPKPPAIVFLIDVSYNNIKSGMVALLCSQMKDIIQNLPIDHGQEKSNMKVGFITYNNSVHFYNIKGSLAAPQMLVVGDVQEMFMPLLDGFLCTPEESAPVIDLLMQQIPTMFADTRETETVLLPAIQAGLEALKASECSGKLMVFHSSLPISEAPGKLKNRDDRKLLGTEREKTILTPQSQAYNQLGQECVAAGCSVDMFLFNNAYIDIATIGQVPRLTGGEVFKYTYFQADLDGERLIDDIVLNISRPIAFDGVMRVRTSAGVRPTDFYGHFYMSNTTDIELAAIDCDKAIGVEIKHDDKLSDDTGVYIQAALLYTSCSGQRRLRIMNLSLKTCSQMADLYRSCDLDTFMNYISKQATYKLLDNNPKVVKDSIVTRAAQILATYRKNCASPSSAGQLILPECMKLLPAYVNCLLKTDAISGGSDMTIDDRSFAMQVVMTMDIPSSVNYFYPRLIPIHDVDPAQDPVTIPNPIRCTIDKMNEQGVYILENGIHMFLWFGLAVNPDFIQKLFGAPSAIQVDVDRISLPELDNPLSVTVRSIIDEIRIQRHRCMRLTLVRQREKLEPVFKHFLVEDRGSDASPSYVDFLCHMHKEIRNLLS